MKQHILEGKCHVQLSNLYNLIKSLLPKVTTPFIKELPYICLFMLMMDVSHILGLIYLRILDLYQNAASPGYIELLGRAVFIISPTRTSCLYRNRLSMWGMMSLKSAVSSFGGYI